MPAGVGTASWAQGSAPRLQVWTREEKKHHVVTTEKKKKKEKPKALQSSLYFAVYSVAAFPKPEQLLHKSESSIAE